MCLKERLLRAEWYPLKAGIKRDLPLYRMKKISYLINGGLDWSDVVLMTPVTED